MSPWGWLGLIGLAAIGTVVTAIVVSEVAVAVWTTGEVRKGKR